MTDRSHGQGRSISAAPGARDPLLWSGEGRSTRGAQGRGTGRAGRRTTRDLCAARPATWPRPATWMTRAGHPAVMGALQWPRRSSCMASGRNNQRPSLAAIHLTSTVKYSAVSIPGKFRRYSSKRVLWAISLSGLARSGAPRRRALVARHAFTDETRGERAFHCCITADEERHGSSRSRWPSVASTLHRAAIDSSLGCSASPGCLTDERASRSQGLRDFYATGHAVVRPCIRGACIDGVSNGKGPPAKVPRRIQLRIRAHGIPSCHQMEEHRANHRTPAATKSA